MLPTSAPVHSTLHYFMQYQMSQLNTDISLCLQIIFLEPSNKTLVNSDLKPEFWVPIVLGNVKDRNKTSNLITRNGTCPVNYHATSFPFTCELHFDSPVADIDIQDVFAVYQDFNIVTG